VGEVLQSTIQNETTADLLEIQVFQPDDLEMKSPLWTERPPFSKHWVAAFHKWTKGRTLDGRKLRAGVENISVQACVDASVSYFTSEEHIEIVGNGLIEDLTVNRAVQAVVADQLKSTGQLTKREIEDLMKVHGGHIAAERAHEVISANMQVFLSSKLGMVLAHMLGAALAMPVVKVAILKAVVLALSNVAVQHALIVAAKHAGIAALVVVFFGSAGASVLSWMLAPIILGVLRYQYVTMPKTLAKEITPKVVEAISREAPTINESVTVAISETILKEFFNLSKDTMGCLHDEAVEKWNGEN
jgi:hypothetical protein